MAAKAGRLVTVIIACIAVLSAGCARAKVAQVKVLSDQEFADLWNRAAGHEPVGKPVVRRMPDEKGMTTVTTQVYMFQDPRGGRGVPPGGVMVVCGFACIAPEGTKPSECKTSGCEPSGLTCTPASCGNCTLSQPCKREAGLGIFGGGTFIASLDRVRALPR